jgi:metal-responsive CopG/Arc/MetJ family transcriptional regulator
MAEKKSKIQITLPSDLIQRIEEDISETYTNKSLWFEKIVNYYFENKDKGMAKSKKVIELEI